MKSNFLDTIVFEATKKAISDMLPSEKERQNFQPLWFGLRGS